MARGSNRSQTQKAAIQGRQHPLQFRIVEQKPFFVVVEIRFQFRLVETLTKPPAKRRAWLFQPAGDRANKVFA